MCIRDSEYTALSANGLAGTGETVTIRADQVLKAIGQTFEADGLNGLDIRGGRIAIDAEGRTSLPKVWAGGDCVKLGEDLTVTSVAQGRDAAESITRALVGAARTAA